MTATLATDGLTVDHGGVRAVADVSLEVRAGRVTGLIGPNGAGKTTLLDAVTGFVPGTGSILLSGRDISGLPPHRRAAAGVARTFQAGELFRDLTVLENVVLPTTRTSWRSVLVDAVRPGRRHGVDAARAALERFGLDPDDDRRPHELPLGQQKLLGVARAVAPDPSVVLLDEPAAGLDPHETSQLGVQLRDLAGAGLALLLVDHDMDLVLEVCDEIYVMDVGRIIAAGPPQQVCRDEAVVAAYLGRVAAGVDGDG